MNGIDFQLFLIETDPHRQERLTLHIPHSGKLDTDHPYFRKRIIWTLTKKAYTNDYPYEAIEEDQRNGIRYQEIPIELLDSINGIDAHLIQKKLNTTNCFTFDYIPTESDNLAFRNDYIYEEIKAIERPHSRALKLVSFTFQNGKWSIDEEYERRITKKSRQGVVEIKMDAHQ